MSAMILIQNILEDYLGENIVLISTPGIILMPYLRAASRASGMPDIVSWSVRARTLTCYKTSNTN